VNAKHSLYLKEMGLGPRWRLRAAPPPVEAEVAQVIQITSEQPEQPEPPAAKIASATTTVAAL